MTSDDLERFLVDVRARVDGELDRILALGADDPGRLCEAMRYAVLGGGKRLRPAVTIAAAAAAGRGGPGSGSAGPGRAEGHEAPFVDVDVALPAACAIELLHAYTLVHDDLPAMDDDDERRGRPTVHVAFGEATAILAGDALLTCAFGTLASLGARAADAVAVLARRAGPAWLLAGQARDLALGDATPDSLEELERVHREKTGALFSAAAELGGIAAGADRDARDRLADFGLMLGVAFQHADDLADHDHPRWAVDANRRVRELVAAARERIAPFGARAATLVGLAEWVERSAA